jgi:ADP-heptose:LPS heptosyltransferase
MTHPRRILISRTDAIGDVMLTLPMATILKQQLPDVQIGFLGKSYTRPVIECCSAVDFFVDADDFLAEPVKDIRKAWDAIIHVYPRKDIALKAWLAGIPTRIGTYSRPYHWLTCNKLIKLKRRQSDLHEAQLNIRLLRPFGIKKDYTTGELASLYSFDRIPPLPADLNSLFQPGKTYVILHPKSQGSAREWGLDHFASLVRQLPGEQFQVFISGTAKEAAALRPLFEAVGDAATNITGRMNLSGFIAFIARCDALVAASTGPLHIAAALGKQAIGIYPPIRPMHAGRWGPVGPRAAALHLVKKCSDCRNSPEACGCIRDVAAAEVAGLIIG